MTLVFLAADNRTLVARHADHVHVEATDDEEEQVTYYESTFFFLDSGVLVLATSDYARERCGEFLGAVADGEDPERLRELADREVIARLNVSPARMQ